MSFYDTPDPWGFQTHRDDEDRKRLILDMIEEVIPDPLDSVLDIAAGEGWITTDLPAKTIHAIEIDDLAASRFPDNVERVSEGRADGYDLTCCMGALYRHYDFHWMLRQLRESSLGWALVAGIKEWLVDTSLVGKRVFSITFPYRDYEQYVVIYDTTSA